MACPAQADIYNHVMELTFTDGTHTAIEVSEDMRLDFDSESLQISSHDGNRLYSLGDIRSFSYTKRTSAGSLSAGTGISFSADGISIMASEGRHTCRVFGVDGLVILSEDFNDTLFISRGRLVPGTVLIQLDGDRTFKLDIR